MTEIEELIEAAEQVLARLGQVPEPVSWVYIDGLYIEAVIYRELLW